MTVTGIDSDTISSLQGQQFPVSTAVQLSSEASDTHTAWDGKALTASVESAMTSKHRSLHELV